MKPLTDYEKQIVAEWNLESVLVHPKRSETRILNGITFMFYETLSRWVIISWVGR